MTCTDTLQGIHLDVPVVPCHELTNPEAWKSYIQSIHTLSQQPEFKRIVTQGLCQHGSTCFAKEMCSTDLFGNPGAALANPDCRRCLFQSDECKPFQPQLNQLGMVMDSIRSTPVTAGDAIVLVKQCCNVQIDPQTAHSIALALNDSKLKSELQSSNGWTSPTTWIIIGLVAFVLFGVGVWVFSKKGHISRTIM